MTTKKTEGLPAKKVYFGGCPQDCPDTCAFLYEVEDEKLVKVKANSAQPYTRNGLCVKMNDFAQHHKNPDRLLYPMRRVGPKGSDEFERISWDDALSEIKTRFTDIINEYGSQAILPYSYLGNQGVLQGLNTGDAFFHKLGATVCERSFCGEGSATAYMLTLGPTGGVDPESFVHAKFIIIWACNTLSTNLHHWPFINEARERGAKVVVIDSYRSRTARQADWHIMPRPGTDGALAMAMINTIIEEGLADDDYVEKYTVGFEELSERASTRTPEWAEEITGIKAEEIRQLAREYATAQPAAIRIGVALERHAGGGQTIRAVCCLPGLVGAWRHVGGGILQMPLWEMPFKLNDVARPDWIEPGTPVINALQLGRALTGEMDLATPVKAVMVYNANPVSQAPEAEKIVDGFKREDLFVVSSEHFLTDTAKHADIVLPATMAAEMDDIMLSWGTFYVTLNQKAIEAPGEAVPNTELFRRLAATFGFDDEQFKRTDIEMIKHYTDWDSPALEGIDYDYLLEHGFAHLTVGTPDTRAPHKEGNFPTDDGKCHFKAVGAKNFVAEVFREMYTDMQSNTPLDELPDYVPPRESARDNPALAATFPLNIVSPKSHAFLNSQYANEAHKVRMQGEQFVLINPVDAELRSIEQGSAVRVYNDRGEFMADAKVTEDVPPGVVVSSLGYWRSLTRGGSVNVISHADFVDMGNAPALSDNLVNVALTNQYPESEATSA